MESLASCSTKPAILSVWPGYCEHFVPKSLSHDLPVILTSLYNSENLKLDYHDLLQASSEANIMVSQEQVLHVEQQTRGQSCTRLWNRMRSGRITASRFKAACRTDPCLPSRSLVGAICYPELAKFNSKATSWSCDHENIAREVYIQKNSPVHKELAVKECGFFISEYHPFIGASPDGLISCICYGEGVLEIKVNWSSFK